MTSKKAQPQPLPITPSTPHDRPIIAWCPDLADWAIIEYTTRGDWRDTRTYRKITPTHWLPIELPEIQEEAQP